MCEKGHCIYTTWRNGKYVYVCINCNEVISE